MLSLFRVSFFSEVHFLSTFAHNLCLGHLPNLSQANAELSALVCGEDFHLLSQSALYVSSGLIHLFVVSGAHLVVIESFLQQLLSERRQFRIYIFLLLYIYGFMCSMNPPICRCLISLTLNDFLLRRNIFWPFGYRVFLSGILCLTVNPAWIDSLSLQMSWLAAFGVSWAGEHLKHAGPLRQQILFYFALLPCLIFLQVPGPSVIAVNLLFAPVLEFVLFPLGISTMIVPISGVIFEKLIILLREILSLCEFNVMRMSELSVEHRSAFIWAFILALHWAEYIFNIHVRRKGN